MECKNCGQHAEGKFCSHCGQRTEVGRITFRSLLGEVSEGVFKVNQDFLNTLMGLFLRPGISLQAFLEGRRKQYVKPITYVLTLSTFYFLVTQFTGQNTWFDDLVSGFMEGALERNKDATAPPLLIWLSNNYAYAALLLLPVFSLASSLAFRKLGKNYFEHIVINSYITGQQTLLYAFFALVGTLIKHELIEAFPFLIAPIYAFWVFWQVFPKGNRIVNLLRSLLTYLLYLFFSTLLFVSLLAIVKL